MQLKEILYYIRIELNNEIASKNLYDTIKNEIIRHSYTPEAYKPFIITKDKRKYYRFNVKSYSIFYTVNNDTMEIRRIYYGKREFKKLLY